MKKILIAAMIAVSLTACVATGPTKEQLASANYGTVTFQQSESLIREYLNRVLLDPQSAQVSITKTQLDHWAKDSKGNYHFGKLIGFEVNAKNAYGGYTGKKRYYAFVERGTLAQVYDVLTDGVETYPHLREIR